MEEFLQEYSINADFLSVYGKTLLDIILVFIFWFIVFSNIRLLKFKPILKGLSLIVFLWFISKVFELSLAESVLRYIIQFSVIAFIVLFPNEFKDTIQHISRKRLFSGKSQFLLNNDNRKEVAKAILNMSKRRHGGIVVIARKDNLDDIAVTGELTGELPIRQSFIETIFYPNQLTNKGALIIQDNVIIGVNAQLPVLKNEDFIELGAGKRHLAGLGISSEKDCMTIVVSGETGAITIVGKINSKISVEFGLQTKEVDIIDGIDEQYIIDCFEKYLKGTETQPKPVKTKKEKAPKRKGGA